MGGPGAPVAPSPRFELVTREGCHLCDEMEEVARPILARFGIVLVPLDVDADPMLAGRYGEVVPVLLRDGSPVAKVRVTALEVERLVRRRR